MSKPMQMFAKLRQNIRQSGKQYRHNADNSPSIFNPNEGFTYAYDMNLVEEALDNFEASIQGEYIDEDGNELGIEQRLIKEAQMLVATHTDMDVRDFARSVAAYLVINRLPSKPIDPAKILKLVRTVDSDHTTEVY